MKPNPLFIAIAAVLAVGVGTVTLHSCSKSEGKQINVSAGNMPDMPTVKGTDAENSSASEQIKTLVAGWKEKEKSLEKMKRQLDEMKAEKDKLKLEIKNIDEKRKHDEMSWNDRITQEINKSGVNQIVGSMKSQILALENEVRSMNKQPLVDKITDYTKPDSLSNAKDVTVDHNDTFTDQSPAFTKPSSIAYDIGLSRPVVQKPRSEEYKNNIGYTQQTSDGWVLPSDVNIQRDKRGKGEKITYSLSKSDVYSRNMNVELSEPVNSDTDSNKADSDKKKKENNIIPFGTIPQETTITNAVTLSALIGKIPVGGKFIDPFAFKVLVGNENLAANGIHVPHLKNMIFSGVAKGNYTGSCVSGDITGGSYIFDDGTIQSFDAATLGKKGNQDAIDGSVTATSLGYIGSKYGIQCIQGKYISDAPSFIALQGGMAALSGIANGYAEAAKTVTGSGDNRQAEVSKPAQFAGATAANAAAKSTSDWVDGIRKNAFGMVYLPPNQEITLNITKDIPINYDLKGRKVSYEQNWSNENEDLD